MRLAKKVEKELGEVETRPYIGLRDRAGNKIYLGDVVSVPDIIGKEYTANIAVVVRAGQEYALSCFKQKGKVERRLKNKEASLEEVLRVSNVER